MNGYQQRRALMQSGMTEIGLVVVIGSITLLVTLLYVGARAWKRGADRSANIMNIRNCQQAMRGVQGMRQLHAGEPFTRQDLEEYMRFPQHEKVSYRTGEKVTPESADPATNWNHIWLVPSPSGMPWGVYGHDSYEDVTGW